MASSPAPAPAASSGVPAVDPVTAGIQVATAVANTIAGISDMNKRRRFEQALATLTNNQTKELNEKMLQARTDTERLQILSTSIVQFAIANENAAANKDTVMYIIAGSLAAVILISAIVYAIKRK